MDWFRSWHGAPTDNKWLVIGKRAKVAPGMVSAVAWALLDYASQNSDRGSVDGFDVETYAIFTGWDESQVEAVIDAMRSKGIITADNRLAAWDKRQPKREDATSTERVRRHRAAKSVTSALPNTDDDVTQGNAVKHSETQSNDRLDKSRLDEKREEGIMHHAPPPAPFQPALPSDPEFANAIASLERLGPLAGRPQMEFNDIWSELTNGRRAWVDDAVNVAIAMDKRSVAYAVRVLSNAIRDDKRPGQAPERKQNKRGGTTSAELDAIFGVDIHGNPV